MKKLVALSTVVLTGALLTACSDDPETSEVVEAFKEAREQTRNALKETKEALEAMEKNKDSLEAALERLDRVAEIHEEGGHVHTQAVTPAPAKAE